jgi:hypothetical protein
MRAKNPRLGFHEVRDVDVRHLPYAAGVVAELNRKDWAVGRGFPNTCRCEPRVLRFKAGGAVAERGVAHEPAKGKATT